MKVLFAFFAKFADILQDGSFAVIGGGFSCIVPTTTPVPGAGVAAVAGLAYLANLAIPKEECGIPHTVKLEVKNKNGEVITSGPEIPFQAQINPSFPDLPAGFTAIFNIMGVPTVPGVMRFHLLGDGAVDLGYTELFVAQLQTKGA